MHPTRDDSSLSDRRRPRPPLRFLLDNVAPLAVGLLGLAALLVLVTGAAVLWLHASLPEGIREFPEGPLHGLLHHPVAGSVLALVSLALLVWAVREHMRRGRFFLSILEQDSTAVALRDGKGRLLFANKAFRDLLQEPGHERLDQLLQDGGEDLSALVSVGQRWVRLRGRPVRNGQRDEGSLVIGLDETAAHEAGEGRRFRAFAGLITHELKTPMTPLRLGLDQIQREVERLQQPPPESLRRVLGRMRSDLDSMTRLLRQFMSLAGERQVRERVDLNHVVELAVNRAGLRQLPFVECRVRTSHRAAWVRGEEGMLVMVVGGLVANALEAMGSRGRIELVLEPRPADGEAESWELDVRDYGPGVPAEVMDRIWEPGFSSRPGGGSGYGLYFARTVVLDLRGQIRLIRPPEGGALFRLTLPAWSESGEAQEHEHETGVGAEFRLASPSGSREVRT